MVCISVSLGFRPKPNDTALLSVIALTTFKCIVSASVTKSALVCFVVTVHWWRHRTHYDVTKAYRALRNILTVHLNNGATQADLRGIPKHCKVTAKAGRQSIRFWCDFLYHQIWNNPYSYSGFLWARCSLGILNKWSGLRPSGFAWQMTSARLAGDVIQVWINSSPSNHCISQFKAQVAQLFLFNILYERTIRRRDSFIIKSKQGGIMRSARRPLTSLGMSAWPYRVTTKYSYYNGRPNTLVRMCVDEGYDIWILYAWPFY